MVIIAIGAALLLMTAIWRAAAAVPEPDLSAITAPAPSTTDKSVRQAPASTKPSANQAKTAKPATPVAHTIKTASTKPTAVVAKNSAATPAGEQKAKGSTAAQLPQAANSAPAAGAQTKAPVTTPGATAQKDAKSLTPTEGAAVAVSTEPAPADFSISTSTPGVRVVQGTACEIDVNLALKNHFAGSVAFSVTGLPPGITADFKPTKAATTYPILLTAGFGAASGPSVLTITGTAGSVSRTTTVKLSVLPHPDFSLAAWTTALPVWQSQTAVRTIWIKSLNGFADEVTLHADGLPKGIVAHFSPARSTGSSTLILASDASSQPGDYTIQIVANSGTLTHTWGMGINVVSTTQPDFTLTAWPAAIPVTAGGAAANTVTIMPTRGFSSPVDLTVSGLPNGLTAMFAPSTTTGMSMLTITAAPDAAVGAATLTITGRCKDLMRSTSTQISISSSRVADGTTLPPGTTGPDGK